MFTKPGWFILIAAFTAVVAWAIYRDIQIEQLYTSDLRNRVVGARLEKEHRSPYFYTWSPTDSLRYYDPANIDRGNDPLHVSNITATPFFHHLLAPFADLPERTISRAWLLLEYLLLAVSALIALMLAVNRQQKAMVLIVTALFLLTEAWKFHVATGQYYLLIPFLALLFYFFFRSPGKLWCAAAAGLCAILLVLVRPNALVFFIPFLFVLKRYSLRYITAFFLPVILLIGWSLASGEERSLWLDYKKFLGEEVKIHQSDAVVIEKYAPSACNYEGWRQQAIDSSYARYPYQGHSEHGNVFVLFEKVFHRKTNVLILNITGLVILALLLAFYWWSYHRRPVTTGYNLLSIAIFGFCLYMVSDLFSPMWRHQYYTVQWLCPLLLAASAWKPAQRKWFMVLGLAMLLSIFNLPFMKMEHTIGEYLILGVLLLLSVKPDPVH